MNTQYSTQEQGSETASGDVSLASLQRQFHAVTAEIAQLGRLVREGAQEALKGAAHKADGVRADTADRVQDAEDQTAEWIRERPFQAALISMGVGALLWSMIKRS